MTEPPFDVVCDSNIDRASWLERRREGIGGSDAPAILNLTNFASPASVQADKWGLIEEPAEAEHMRWGRRLESAILEALADELGEDVHACGLMLRSKTHPFMQCTPDGITDSGIYVQAKNSMLVQEWEGRPPRRVWCQVQHEMAVTGELECIVVALLLGNRLVWSRVERDQNFIETALYPAEREFWDLTQEGLPARPDASEHTKRALGLIYPETTGETVSLDGRFTDLDIERVRLLEEKKENAERILEIENEFRHAIKDATWAVLQNGVIYSLKSQTRKEHTVKASTFRVLRRKKGGSIK